MPPILCVLEQRDGVLRRVSHEVVAAGRKLADDMGTTVDALVFGQAAVEGVEALGASGADRVLLATHDAFRHYSPDGQTATTAGLAAGYSVIVFAATATGKDLAPRVAARVGTSCATEVTEIGVLDGQVVVTRPVYAGRAIQRVRLTASPAVLSIRPNTFPAAETGKPGTMVAIPTPDFTARVEVVEVKAPAEGVLDVGEATIVVSGGRGLKGPENFSLIEDLADAFGQAAVGASRAVVDAGWRDHSAQVGQTGKTVSPALYVAIGISGAIQHLAGMRTAKVIVAINRDKDAPIFKVADYGIVGDLFEVVPRMAAEVRKLRAEG
ncbi:MAG: electron transfer flavoprotein subunit alpha/FixB family protein [Gemmatimonadales bacterium]|nr:MAG: electron transfer flavoprotein subunit alpha/FixB family protein [Gemmatimonadales bacterium]